MLALFHRKPKPAAPAPAPAPAPVTGSKFDTGPEFGTSKTDDE